MKSLGQVAYEEFVRRYPSDRLAPRREPWEKLTEGARALWERTAAAVAAALRGDASSLRELAESGKTSPTQLGMVKR